MDNRRVTERRKWTTQSIFPLFDSGNTLVREDRRKVPDRRLGNIELEWKRVLPKSHASRLLLRHQDEIRSVSPDSKTLVVGRHSKCDLVIRDLYASRVHARFEYTDGEFVIIDQSTNGTFLKTEFESNVHLLDDRLLLMGSGVISLGKPIQDSDDKDVLHFFAN